MHELLSLSDRLLDDHIDPAEVPLLKARRQQLTALRAALEAREGGQNPVPNPTAMTQPQHEAFGAGQPVNATTAARATEQPGIFVNAPRAAGQAVVAAAGTDAGPSMRVSYPPKILQNCSCIIGQDFRLQHEARYRLI